MTEPEPGPPDPETPEDKEESQASRDDLREEVMKRLAEMLRRGPPDLSGAGGAAASGGFPTLPTDADEFDQESASALFAALGDFFKQHKDTAAEAGSGEPERE